MIAKHRIGATDLGILDQDFLDQPAHVGGPHRGGDLAGDPPDAERLVACADKQDGTAAGKLLRIGRGRRGRDLRSIQPGGKAFGLVEQIDDAWR